MRLDTIREPETKINKIVPIVDHEVIYDNI